MRWALVVLLVACSGSEASPRQAPHAGEVGEPEPVEPEPEEPPQDNDACGSLRAQTASILGEPVQPCQVDPDCACYPAFIDCGGVTRESRATRLQSIADQGQALGCGYRGLDGFEFDCSPRLCNPSCQDGICVNR